MSIRAKHEPRFPVRYSDSIRKHPKLAKLLRYNEALTLRGIPPAAFDYRLGGRSALEWVPDKSRTSTAPPPPPRSGITNDPNPPGGEGHAERYILRLIGQIITVSLETQKIIATLPSLNFPA